MRVLQLVADPGIPLDGHKGASVHVAAIRAALERRGHDVVVAAAGAKRDADDGRVIAIPVADEQGFARFRAAARWLDAHHARIEALGRFDVVLERLALFPGAGIRLARALGARHVFEVNAPLAEEMERHRGLTDAAAREAEDDALRASDGLAVVSRALVERSRRLGRSDASILHLPNGVDVERFARAGDRARRRSDLGIAADACVFVFSGTLKPWHGVDLLLAAFERVFAVRRDAHLLVVGDGPEGESLRARASRSLDAGAITWTGKVAHDDVPALLAAADVGCAPYPALGDFYFSPLKVGEYAAAGLPVLRSPGRDMDDLLPEDRGSIVVSAGDTAALATAMVELVDDPVRRARAGAAARAHAADALSWDSRADALERFVHALPMPAPRARHVSASE
ncbi:MAG: glycosyltransferase family 4 protein [Planctomycetes bacterium]|nr:glycosyltransferase family 4 protein [Planctomycetota bacterium]